MAHIAWVKGGDLSDLASIFASRIGVGQAYGPGLWSVAMLNYSRRIATVSGTVAMIWLALRALRGLTGRIRLSPIEEYAAIFLTAGIGYLVAFNWGAWQHVYWLYPLLPAVAIGLGLAVTRLARRAAAGPRSHRYRALLALLVVEVPATSTFALYSRHATAERRVLEAVAFFQSRSAALESPDVVGK
jgi:hypothetical protein